MARKKKSLSEAVSSEIKANFNLESFKNKKGLTSKAKFKEQRKKDFKKEKKERQKKWAEFKGNIQQKYWDWKGKRYRSEYGDPDTPYDIPGLV